MALKAIIENLDDVPEAIRGEYREGTKKEGAEGKYVLDVTAVEGFALEDVAGLRHVLQSERANSETMRGELKKFGSTYDSDKKQWLHTFDPKKAKDAIEKYDEFSKFDPDKESDKIASTKFEAWKTQVNEKHGEELQERDGRIGQLSTTVEKLMIDSAATAAIAEAKGSVELLLPHVKNCTRVKEEDGSFAVEVVDPKTGVARIGDGKGSAMTIKDLIEEMKASDTFARAFDGNGQSGSGMTQTTGGTKPGSEKGNWAGTAEERQAAIKSRFKLTE